MHSVSRAASRATPSVQRLTLVLAVVTTITFSYSMLCAQSVDVTSERVSLDAQRLSSMSGESYLGRASVWPVAVGRYLDRSGSTVPSSDPMLTSFKRWVDDYYTIIDAAQKRNSLDTSARSGFLTPAGGRYVLGYVGDGASIMQLDASLMLRTGFTELEGTGSESFLLMRPSFRAMGSLFDSHVGFFLDLSNGMRFSGTSARIALSEPALGRTFKFMVEEQKFFDRYIGYIQYQAEHLRVRFGREQIQYGFSPIDNLIHSLNAPMMDGLLIDVPYGPLRFTSTHSQAEGTDTSGKAVPGKYVATHRFSFDPVPWLSVSLSDMIVYWGRGLDFTYLNPLAFFVSAGLGTDDRSRNDNSMLALDAAIRPFNGTTIYGMLLIDDLSYATLSDTTLKGNNNKFAVQLGASQLVRATSSMPLMFTAEYVRIDPFTFSHRSINASYTTLGAPLGYNMQSNSDRMALQGHVWFTPRTSLKIDIDYTRHGENFLDSNNNIIIGQDPRYPDQLAAIGNVGGDILRGDGDFLVGNRFLKGNVSHQRRIYATFTSELFSNIFVDARAGYENRNGGNTPGTFLFGYVEVRVGY